MHDSHVAKCYTKLGTVYLSKAGGSEYAVTLFLGDDKPLSRQHCSSLEEGLEVFADKVQRKIRLAEREEGYGVAQGTNNERGGEGV